MNAASCEVTIPIAADVLRRIWRLRFGLASLLATIGGVSVYFDSSAGWYLVAIASVLIVNSLVKLRGLKHAPRIELFDDRMEVWGVLVGTPRSIPYASIRFVEWRVLRDIGLARVSTTNRFAFLVTSSWLQSRDDFHKLIREFECRLTQSRVLSWRMLHTTTAYVSMCVALGLFAIHGFLMLRNPSIDVITVMANGAFSPVLVSSGEWFRLVTDAGLHASWLHLLLNVMLIAMAFAELEERIGHARVIILMVVGAVFASLATWTFSPHQAVIGASGMAYAALGAIAYQLIRIPASAPLSFRLMPPWWLLVMMFADVAFGLAVPEVSFAMHAGGFVSGAVTMAALSGTLGTASRTTKWIVNGLAGIGVALVGSSAFALYRYNAADHPEHLMQVRLLSPQLPAEVINAAAYRLVRNPGATREELKAALIGIGRVLSSPATAQLSGDLLAAYSDTAAMLSVRTGDLAAGRALELRAVALATRTRSARQPKAGMYLARVVQFELAAPAPAREATVTITARAHELCVSAARPAAAAQSLRAVAMRNDAPIGLLLVPDSRRGVATCVPAAVAAGDRVRVTYVGAARAAGAPRFFAVRARDADLPAFVLGP